MKSIKKKQANLERRITREDKVGHIGINGCARKPPGSMSGRKQ